MRAHAVVFAALVLCAGVSLLVAADDDAKKDLEALKGNWTVVSAERDGKKLTDEQLKDVMLTLDGTGKATVKKGDQVLFDGTIKIDPTKKPKALDTTQTSDGENKGKTLLGIYELDGDTLKICTAEPAGKDRPTEFSSKPGSGNFLRVYKREKK